MKNLLILPLLLLTLLVVSCDEKINPALKSGAPIYVVDAFINNKPGPQVIHLSKSQPYFDETLPPGVSGAAITVTSIQTEWNFVEDPTVPGDYKWTSGSADDWVVGQNYSLTITIDGETFAAESRLGRVPPVDSITFSASEFPGEAAKNFYRAQFWASDLLGVGDTYWIRASKNGELLNKPSELNLAYDATFSKGSIFDGYTFIQPIRTGVNPDDSNVDNAPSPYSPGDSLYVEIYSLTEASFNYLNEISVQTNRPGGFSELFARPLANVSTNIRTATGTPVAGFFNVSSVSGRGRKFVK